MRIFLTIVLLVLGTSFAVAGNKEGLPPKKLRRSGRTTSFSLPRTCAQAVTDQDMVTHIARSANFRALAKPGQTQGTRFLKLVVLQMADDSLVAAYGPLTLGIFLEPAIDKLGEHFLNLAMYREDKAALERSDPIGVWVGEIETCNGILTRASFRDLRNFNNDESVLLRFTKEQNFPWAVAPSFRPTRLRSNLFHLRNFMNLPDAREYTDYYEEVGNALGYVARAYELVQGCIDRDDMECARKNFRDAVRLARDGEENDSRRGLIAEFEMMAREDGLSYPEQKDQNRFNRMVEEAAVNANTVAREEMEFFRKTITRLSAWVNLSRPNTQVSHAKLFPLIYIVTDEGGGEIEPVYAH